MAKTIFNMADGILTSCNDIDFARWLHPAMWHVALGTWQWIYQVAEPCNVIRGSGMTCHWIRPVAAPCNVTRSSGIMTLNLPGGSTLQCGRWLRDDMPLNSPKRRRIGILHLVWFRPYHRSWHVILHQSAKFYPNRTTLGRKKWRNVDFQDGDLSHLGF